MSYVKNRCSIYAPTYFNEFKCISSNCKHSCCVNWEICIDEKTLKKYKKIGRGIIDTIIECEDSACFKLSDTGKCPHLNSDGLCNIIIEHGESLLSDICNNHPRFYNRVSEGRIEAGIGIACEEACRLILVYEHPFSLVEMPADKCRRIPLSSLNEDLTVRFDAIPYRNAVFSALENSGMSFNSATQKLYDMFEISELYTADEWTSRLSELEILDTGWRDILSASKSDHANVQKSFGTEFDKYYMRLLTYFVFRHVSCAESYDNLRARLGFAILSAKMIKHLFEISEDRTLNTLIDIARLYSSEIEYSEENTAEIIFEFESSI